MNFDPYYQRSEVSNSDLTALKLSLHPNLNFMSKKARNKAFHLGTLVDALVTEPKKCNHYRMTVDDEKYTKEEWKWGGRMLSAIRKEATRDAFLDYVLKNADGQRWFVNPGQEFNLVLEGRMLLSIGGKELTLNQGDSIYFDSTLPHGMKALDQRTVKFLAIIM